MWRSVAECGREISAAAGEVLVHHGDATDHCYAIVAGEVVVSATTMQGATVVLGRRGPGELVGELAALGGTARSGTVRARTAVTARVLTAAELADVIRRDPEAGLAWLRWLAGEYRLLTERFAGRGEELADRLVQLLRINAEETGDPTFRSTREELAGWVGATREGVTRSLKELEATGCVVLDRGSVRLVV